MQTIPWYQSNTLRGLLVAVVAFALNLAGLDQQFPDAGQYVDKALDLVTLSAMVFAAWARTRQATPPISQAAVDATIERNQTLRSPALVGVIAIVLTAMTLSACTHTREAYREAASVDETAYVLAEHYAALVHEAANLAEKPSTPAAAVDAMRRAELAARPAVFALRDLRDAYVAARSAENEAALQAAVNRAVQVIADLVRAVQAARASPTARLDGRAPVRTIVNYQPRPLAAGVAV